MSSNDLKGRVAQRAEGNGNGGQVAATEQRTISQFIEAMKGELARALPKHQTADRLVRIALTEIRRNPKLAQATEQSFGGALMTCAQLGLEPGVTGEAYLVPYKSGYLSKRFGRDVYEVQLIIGYQGMAKLFWQSPLARSLDAQAVYANDEFDFAYGLEPRLYHKPALSDRGDPIAYYAVATMSNGGSGFVVMSPEDIDWIRNRSKAKDDGPWQTDYDAMAKKTCVRQLFKLIPRSPEIAQAMAQDETVRNDMTAESIDLAPANSIPGEVEPEAAPDAPQAAESASGGDPLHYDEDDAS